MEVLRKILARMGRIPCLLCPWHLSFCHALCLFGVVLVLSGTQLAAQEDVSESPPDELLQGLGAPNSQQLQEQMERAHNDSASVGFGDNPVSPDSGSGALESSAPSSSGELQALGGQEAQQEEEAAPSRQGIASESNSDAGNLEPNHLQPATPNPPAAPLLSSPLPEMIPRMIPSEIPGMIPGFLVEPIPPTMPSEPTIVSPGVSPAQEASSGAGAAPQAAPVRSPTSPRQPSTPPPLTPSAAVSTLGIANAPALLPNQQKGDPLKKIDISKHVNLGQSFSLTLHGLIWTYIPALSEYPIEPSFERQLGNLETGFRFEFRRTGRYLLTFSRQLPSTGKLEYYTAEIIVEEPEVDDAKTLGPGGDLQLASRSQTRDPAPQPSFQPLASAQTGTSATMRITTQVLNDVRAQLDAGDLDAAYQTLSSWPPDERGDIFDSAGEAFLEAGRYKEAAEMWERNKGLSGDLADKATVGATRAAERARDFTLLARWLPDFLQLAKRTVTGPKDQGALLSDREVQQKDFANLYELLNSSSSIQPGPTGGTSELGAARLLDFYQTYIDLYPDNNSSEILYNMALSFEKPGGLQNLRKARDLYTRICTEYPVDAYNAKAKQRLDYLNRQFFYVQ